MLSGQRDFRGASGLFSIVLQPGPAGAVAAFLDDLRLFGLGYSWGGFESLAIPFDATPHRTAGRHEPGGPTVRLHIGLEDVDDLMADLAAGLERYGQASRALTQAHRGRRHGLAAAALRSFMTKETLRK